MAATSIRVGYPTDSTIRRKRFAATDNQRELLQRNIHSQSAAIRAEQDKADGVAQQAKIDRLQRLDALTNPHALDSFIASCFEAVERAFQEHKTPALPDDLGAWDVEVLR